MGVTLVVFVLFGLLTAPAAGAQEDTTTTTAPPVQPIPVTGGGAAGTTSGAPLATTGFSADLLVPMGLGLVAVGSALDGLARRRRLSFRSR
jgi:hypothetical protein